MLDSRTQASNNAASDEGDRGYVFKRRFNMVFDYDLDKRPTRPKCQLEIINPISGQTIKVDAVADTGADMTIIPDSKIDLLGNLIEGESIQCQGVNGIPIPLKTYIVDITVGNHNFSNHTVVAVPNKNHALIGRDILNRNKASFHAKQNCWRLECGGNCR